jgi:ubiquinone/menaquinone biosynthesis C-methylase UbiE
LVGQPQQEKIREYLSFQREEELDPFRVMAFLPIEPYHHIADIGCGPGFFTIPFAKHLIYGKVYALDVDPEMLRVLRERVDDVHLTNVEILQCGPLDFPAPKGSLDGVFLAFVVHEVEEREAFLREAGTLLRPGGWCAVLEWYKKETPGGPPLERRISPEELRELANGAGLTFREWRDLNGKHYMALLRK